MRQLTHCVAFCCGLIATIASGQESVSIATPDRFPDPKTSRYISGELTMVDHVNRMGILRGDRLDSQIKYHQDLPLKFSMLPYGSIFYRGAPASLADIPIGTHLHGWFHLGTGGEFEVKLKETDYAATVSNQPIDRSPDSPWNQVLRLEDDFTFYLRQQVGWEIQSIDESQKQLVARRVPIPENTQLSELAGYPTAEGLHGEQTFDYTVATRVWKQNQIASTEDLQVGQVVRYNLTWATMYGPGRLTDIWIDPESRATASLQQRQQFEQFTMDRGFPGMVTDIEYQTKGEGVVTVHLYAGFDSKHLPLFPIKRNARVIVAESTLRTYDASNDGQFVHVTQWIDNNASNANHPLAPGSSGWVIRFQMKQLLEGIRPGRTVRLKSNEWTRHALPREEKLSPFDLRPIVLLPPTE
ncbi:hypothetical protein [Rhodopirellula sallentina]|uniref:Putative secreted protein n=1 Tax=Rhodopirellula sallentina SM41 TaxID=1263870 RepID=M5TWA4_9BACT|nr:hypothetical protein [Rhodopirellula sallentina]EMI53492.1 putative secreted protein [Rhodopirellula sallentina SM41]